MYQYAIAKSHWFTFTLNKCNDVFHGCLPNLIPISSEEFHSTLVRHNNLFRQYFKRCNNRRMANAKKCEANLSNMFVSVLNFNNRHDRTRICYHMTKYILTINMNDLKYHSVLKLASFYFLIYHSNRKLVNR